MNRDLPKRMYRHGLVFRLHLPSGVKVSLGRELPSALMRYHELMNVPVAVDKATIGHQTWMRTRKGARCRGLSFEITREDVDALFVQQNYCCAVTGLGFKMDRVPHLRLRPWLPSIDRINSKGGYTLGNVRLVCAFVNVAMNQFGERMWLESYAQNNELKFPRSPHAFPSVTKTRVSA